MQIEKKRKEKTYRLARRSLPPEDFTRLDSPYPVRQERVQSKVCAHGCNNPWRAGGFPAEVAIRVEGEGADGDGRVAYQEVDIGLAVVLGESEGLREGGEEGGEGVVCC